MSKFNSWTIYAVLVAMSCVNWDLFIVRYNVQNRNSIEFDPYYMTSLSDQTIVYLWKSKKEIIQWQKSSFYSSDIVGPILERRIAKIQYNQKNQRNHTFWSWNYRSHIMKMDLKSIPYFKYDEYRDSRKSRY